MITDQDIEKLQSVFATKTDLSVFATKDDIKAELVPLHQKIDDLQQEVDGLRESIQMLSVSIDKLVKSVEDLKQEYSLVVHQLDKHEKWIRQIAEKAGVLLLE
ncbi:MAG: hypothetical protein A2719_05415 [Candidatus Ryanbacteria bacterium RIFCSPHIGHO2_01_FULL_45_22]|uniref:Uncharacterized protein n=2 Tax=Candidatus Ryaniibacteriota TaxID=1817914 RepID=A0A1G2FZ40_9BACT|nr:MAG: hypothetical protein A2719_05415 [Candidatus Ryanbacteria bacterium RIFCSPHIGHO2_01_FULL_45_22]OGZ45392.1 MAG: hypothetical protein A3J54_00890 [Candidatus Ryanbacteria bacterium RIFCSPHIGHO2_02_FULL_45_13b]